MNKVEGVCVVLVWNLLMVEFVCEYNDVNVILIGVC